MIFYPNIFMKNIIALFLLVSSLSAFAQDSSKTCYHHHHDNSIPYFTLGATNSLFESVNGFLKKEGYSGTFQPNAISYGVGFIFPLKKNAFDFNIFGSAQHFNSGSKRIALTNTSLQLLYHYNFLNKGWLRSSLFSGVSWQMSYLNIDSIYKPGNMGSFSSTNATKNMFDIPIGLQVFHPITFKNRNKNQNQGLKIGIRASYHFTVYQSDWNIGVRQQNKYAYTLNNTNYFDASLLFVFF